jgi:hypothetical protein
VKHGVAVGVTMQRGDVSVTSMPPGAAIPSSAPSASAAARSGCGNGLHRKTSSLRRLFPRPQRRRGRLALTPRPRGGRQRTHKSMSPPYAVPDPADASSKPMCGTAAAKPVAAPTTAVFFFFFTAAAPALRPLAQRVAAELVCGSRARARHRDPADASRKKTGRTRRDETVSSIGREPQHPLLGVCRAA